ncbi:MAG TPA: hypothetical protein VHE35_04175 [Kofleriaceae bacterium]|nr:hypothetical protein [Kofleriaceae bacterium]
MRSSICLTAVIAMAGCGSKAKPADTTPQPTADDSAVTEGGDWHRVKPGLWTYDRDFDRAPETPLVAPDAGRGIERIDLPAGATGGTVTTISADMLGAGDFTWTVYASDGPGGELGASIASGDGTAPATATPESGAWVDVGLKAPVTTPFAIVFTTRSGEPAVGAIEGDAPGNVYFQPDPSSPAQQTPFIAYVRVSLADVH